MAKTKKTHLGGIFGCSSKMRLFLENLASSVWPLKLHIKFWSNSLSRFWEQLLTHLPEILTNWYTDILWGSFIRCFLPEGKGQKRDEKVSNWNKNRTRIKTQHISAYDFKHWTHKQKIYTIQDKYLVQMSLLIS